MIGVYRVTRISFFSFYFHPPSIFLASSGNCRFFFSSRNNCYDSHAGKKKIGSQHHRAFNSISVTHGVATCQVKIHKLYCSFAVSDEQLPARRDGKTDVGRKSNYCATGDKCSLTRGGSRVTLSVSISINRARRLVRRPPRRSVVGVRAKARDKEEVSERVTRAGL